MLKDKLSVKLMISELMNDREKISTEDIKKYYPDGLTIDKYDAIHNDDGTFFYVCTYREDKTKFFFTGAILSKLLTALTEECSKDSESLKEFNDNGLKVKFKSGKTKSGKGITLITIV